MDDLMQKIVSLCKRRGYIFPGSEIYGGLGGFYDYGPLGVELKNNIKKLWWKYMVQDREDVVGLDSAIIMHPKTWEASGHLESFTDPLVECRHCHKRLRSDNLKRLSEKKRVSLLKSLTTKFPANSREYLENKNYLDHADKICSECDNAINTDIDYPRNFNLLMKTYLGIVENEKTETFLRGETCQGIYLNYKNVLDSTWQKIPFGIAQIGKAFRNEITPGNFTFRMREFEQMEMQYFIDPRLDSKKKRTKEEKTSQEVFEYWKQERINWYYELGLKKSHLRFRDHADNEKAHYAKYATDIEYDSPFGWSEFEGIHHRGDWDLSRHSQFSKVDLSYQTEDNEKFIPNIIETSAGADRSCLFFLIDAYHEETANNKMRIVLKLHPLLSPVKVAVFPLVSNQEKIVHKARQIYSHLKTSFPVMWDDIGNVGKRYRRQDEIGTPWCVTVDYQSLEDSTVTVRDRDTMKQERIAESELNSYFSEKLVINF